MSPRYASICLFLDPRTTPGLIPKSPRQSKHQTAQRAQLFYLHENFPRVNVSLHNFRGPHDRGIRSTEPSPPTKEPKAGEIEAAHRCRKSQFLRCQSDPKMSYQINRSASRAARSLLSASKNSELLFEGRAIAATAANKSRGRYSTLSSLYERANHKSASSGWVSAALALPAVVYMLQDKELHAAELERTFIAIKPDGVSKEIAEIILRFERKGYKLVAVKLVVPTNDFAQKHYHDLKERPFFSGLCDFLSSGPVLAMVWEGEGVIKYGRKLIGATDPQKSEPGTIRGDLAVVVGRNIIHGSVGPETAKDEIALWFSPSELVSYTRNAEEWIYGVN